MSYPYKRMKVNGRCIDRHRYVMEQHLGRKLRPEEIVHHINGDPTDDRIENLELTTRSAHARGHVTLEQLDRIGNARKSRGSANGGAKLTEDQVREIRRRLAGGSLGKDLAIEYGVTPVTISKIKLGKKWAHLPA